MAHLVDRARAPRAHGRARRAGGLGALAALGAAALVRAWRTEVSLRVEVEGPSMLPTLAPGERLLVRRTQAVRPGDLVVVRDPERAERLLVKRAVSVGDGFVEVLGDNERASRDSRQFGPVPAGEVVGRPWYRYAPERSRGRLERTAGWVAPT